MEESLPWVCYFFHCLAAYRLLTEIGLNQLSCAWMGAEATKEAVASRLLALLVPGAE
jgi:hypothetical protein